MDTLHFPSRDVPAYGEYAAAKDLVEGRMYFVAHFLDDQLTIPELQPLVFIGRNLSKPDSDTLYFQDAKSYLAGVRFESGSDDDDAEFHTVDAGTPFVYEFERALDRLLYCSLIREPGGRSDGPL